MNISFVYYSKKSPFHSFSSFTSFPFLVPLCVVIFGVILWKCVHLNVVETGGLYVL